MMKKNQFEFYIKDGDLPANGTFIMQITDAVLDHDCWPVWVIVLCGGVVIIQRMLYVSDVYDVPDMEGWSKEHIVQWVQSARGEDAQQVAHDIMWVSA